MQEMRFLKRSGSSPMVDDTPSDPILPCGVDKVELRDGRVFLLDVPRMKHVIEGNVITGWIVEPSSGFTTKDEAVLDAREVVRHVAMGWRNSDSSLHEVLNLTPYALS